MPSGRAERGASSRVLGRALLWAGIALGGLVALYGVSVAEDNARVSERAPAAAGSVPAPEALRLLGQQLAARVAELDRREAELEELLRGSEVLRRAGLLPPEPPATQRVRAGAVTHEQPETSAFQSLQRVYENMEPDSAARALAQLAARDKDAVVELLLGWKPRTSGAILDALAQANPALAADLSYEIWKRDGRKGG